MEELKSIIIDLENGIYKLNGEDIGSIVSEFHLDFEKGQWMLTANKKACYTVNGKFIEKPETWSPEVTRRKKKAWDKKITQILWIIFLSMIVSIMVVRLTRG